MLSDFGTAKQREISGRALRKPDNISGLVYEKHITYVEDVLTWVGCYNKPEQYENIILRVNPEGGILRLRDVAKVELSVDQPDHALRAGAGDRGRGGRRDCAGRSGACQDA